ncbi:MAG: ATP-binding protein [Polyangia bacterium]
MDPRPELQPVRMSCTRLEDRAAIGVAAFQFARRMGFGLRACREIETCVQELVSNIVRHAGRGSLELRSSTGAARPHLEVLAVDDGPGIPAEAVAASEASQHGLGALRRLMHELEISDASPRGARVRACRYLDRSS